MRERNIDFQDLFDKHKGLVYYFANNNRVKFIEREDYIQSLLLKFWEIIQRFDWERHSTVKEQERAFRGYVKTTLTRYMWELREEFSKDSIELSLDNSFDENEGLAFLDLIVDEGYPP